MYFEREQSAQKTYNDFAIFYDPLTNRFDKDVPLYENLAKNLMPPYLEVGVGTGRLIPHLCDFAKSHGKRDFYVGGIDVSGAMLEVCERKNINLIKTNEVLIAKHDLVTLPLADKFNLAIVSWFTFNYIPESDQVRFLSNARKCLNVDAVLALDLFYPDSIRHPDQAGQWLDKKPIQSVDGEIKLQEFRHMLSETREERIQIFTTPSGNQSEIRTYRNYVTPKKAKKLLEMAGFVDIKRTHKYQMPATEDFEPLPQEKNFVMIASNG